MFCNSFGIRPATGRDARGRCARERWRSEISPWKGAYISRIKKIAAATDRAHRNKVVITVALRGAKRPKLVKIMASQKTSFFSAFFASAGSKPLPRSNLRDRHRAEEYPQHLFPPNNGHQFVHRAVHDNQHEQNDLDGPEMRPHDFLQQLFVAGHKTAGLSPEIDKTLQIVNERGHQ